MAQTREGKNGPSRRDQQGTGTEGQMPTTATKREKKHSKAGRSPSAPTTTTTGKINTPDRAETPKSRKTNTDPKPQPPKRGRRTPQGGQKPQSAKRKTPTTTTKGKQTAQGRPSPRTPINKNTNPNRQSRNTPGRAEATGRQKRNTNSSDQHQRTIANHSHQEEKRHDRGAKHPSKKTNRHLNVGRSPRAPKGKHRTQTTATQGRRRTPQGSRSPQRPTRLTPITTTKRNGDSPGQAEAPGSPEHQTKNTRHNHQKKDTPWRAEATGHQKRNTNSDQHQRTKINRNSQKEEKQNRWGRTTKTKNKGHPWARFGRAEAPERQKTNTYHKLQPLREEDEHPRAGRSPRAPKKQTPTSSKKGTETPGQGEAPEHHTPANRKGRKKERKKIKNCIPMQQNKTHQATQPPGRTNPEAQNATPTISRGSRGAVGPMPTAATKRKRNAAKQAEAP